MTSLPFLVLAAVCVTWFPITQASTYPEVIYLSEKCGQTYMVNGDLRIKLTRQTYLSPDNYCYITLFPLRERRLVASFRDYSMNMGYVNDYGDCRVESIQLNSAYGPVFPNNGYCKSYSPTGQYDLASVATFSYQTFQYSYILPARVDLLVTEVADRNASGYCYDGYFDCERRNYCISDDLTCNGYDDCGNDRDELEGCGLTLGIIGAIVGGVFVFIVVITVISILTVRRYRRRAVYIQYR